MAGTARGGCHASGSAVARHASGVHDDLATPRSEQCPRSPFPIPRRRHAALASRSSGRPPASPGTAGLLLRAALCVNSFPTVKDSAARPDINDRFLTTSKNKNRKDKAGRQFCAPNPYDRPGYRPSASAAQQIDHHDFHTDHTEFAWETDAMRSLACAFSFTATKELGSEPDSYFIFVTRITQRREDTTRAEPLSNQTA